MSIGSGPYNGMVARAAAFALERHGLQLYGGEPYRVHLDAVVSTLISFGYTSDEHLALAWLHDVIEDTHTTPAELDWLPDHMAKALGFLTDQPGANRRERKALTYRFMRDAINAYLSGDPDHDFVPLAIVVKLADRLANVLHAAQHNHKMHQMYAQEHGAFHQALYVAGISDDMWTALQSLLLE